MKIGCSACGQADCDHNDLVYLGIVPSPSAAAFPVAAVTSTGGVSPYPAGHFGHHRSRDRQADALRRCVKRAPVHAGNLSFWKANVCVR